MLENSLKERIIELELAFQECTDERDTMVELLLSCEWASVDEYGERHCPLCGGEFAYGHLDGCAFVELAHV